MQHEVNLVAEGSSSRLAVGVRVHLPVCCCLNQMVATNLMQRTHANDEADRKSERERESMGESQQLLHYANFVMGSLRTNWVKVATCNNALLQPIKSSHKNLNNNFFLILNSSYFIFRSAANKLFIK